MILNNDMEIVLSYIIGPMCFKKYENGHRFALSAIRGRERERERQIINKMQINTHLFVK